MNGRFTVLRSKFSVILVFLCLCLPAFVSAQVPGIINHQGRLTAAGTNFDGTGQFKSGIQSDSGVVETGITMNRHKLAAILTSRLLPML